VDHEGEVLEVFATKRRDRRAALKFLKRALKRYDRHLNRRNIFKQNRSVALAEWRQLAG
jgi:transposase-like protein